MWRASRKAGSQWRFDSKAALMLGTPFSGARKWCLALLAPGAPFSAVQ